MRVIAVAIVLAVLGLTACVVPVDADSVWDYEAVLANGMGAHPLVDAPAYDGSENVIESNKVTIEGVALAGMNDLWNSSMMYTIFVQDDTADRGGMQVWAGNFGWYQPPFTWRPAQYVAFNAGDRVRVRGFLGNHNGKVFINDRHQNDPEVCFTVEVIGSPGLPDPELIPSIANCNYFDQTRNDGGERYQTRFAMLHGVEVGAGTWAGGQSLIISDSTGSTSLYLPPMGGFSGSKPSGRVTIVGIFDQEDPGSGSPIVYHNNYRMILRSPADIAASLDACRDVRNRADGEKVALASKVVSRVYNGYFYIQDADRSGGVRIVTSHPATPGDVVSIMGTVATEGSDKVVTAQYVAKSRLGAGPLVVNSEALHGQTGLDVFGLLVKTSGTIGASLGGGLYEFTDDNQQTIHLKSNGYPVPAQGTVVTVTAVASGNSTLPVLEIGSASDIKY